MYIITIILEPQISINLIETVVYETETIIDLTCDLS